jgi:hypothetical protein
MQVFDCMFEKCRLRFLGSLLISPSETVGNLALCFETIALRESLAFRSTARPRAHARASIEPYVQLIAASRAVIFPVAKIQAHCGP